MDPAVLVAGFIDILAVILLDDRKQGDQARVAKGFSHETRRWRY